MNSPPLQGEFPADEWEKVPECVRASIAQLVSEVQELRASRSGRKSASLSPHSALNSPPDTTHHSLHARSFVGPVESMSPFQRTKLMVSANHQLPEELRSGSKTRASDFSGGWSVPRERHSHSPLQSRRTKTPLTKQRVVALRDRSAVVAQLVVAHRALDQAMVALRQASKVASTSALRSDRTFGDMCHHTASAYESSINVLGDFMTADEKRHLGTNTHRLQSRAERNGYQYFRREDPPHYLDPYFNVDCQRIGDDVNHDAQMSRRHPLNFPVLPSVDLDEAAEVNLTATSAAEESDRERSTPKASWHPIASRELRLDTDEES